MKTIDKFSGEYRWLSNSWPCSVEYEGVVYPSVENAYQAAKTDDLDARKRFVSLSPSDAKKEGRKLKMRQNFEEFKIQIMFPLVLYKFLDHESLWLKLIETGDAVLIEGNTYGDTFWGQCNGQGRNELGKILMMIREELKISREYNYDAWSNPRNTQKDPIDENGNRGDFSFYDDEDYGGQVDGEIFPVLCELIFEADEELCKEPL